MENENDVTEQLVNELTILRQRVARLERDEREWNAREEAQKKSEAKYKALFENAQDAILLVKDNRIVDCNASALKVFGCGREQIVGRYPFEFFPSVQPDGKNSKDQAIKKVADALSGIPQYFEWQHRRWDGTLIDTEVSLDRVDTNDEVLILAMIRDVTTRKEAERALQRGEFRYRTLFDLAPDPIAVGDLDDGRLLDVNQAFELWSGYSRSELIGKTSIELGFWVNPEDRSATLQQVDLLGGIHELTKVKLRKRNGEIRDVIFSARIKERDGKKVLLSVLHDISELKRAEEVLRRSEERFSKAFHSSPAVLCIFTLPDGRYIEVNRAFERTSGYLRHEVLGRTPQELGQLDDPVEFEQVVKTLGIKGSLHGTERGFRSKTGELLHGLFSVDLIELGAETCALVAALDITEQKRIESALRQREAELERKSVELEEINIALRVLLKQREQDQKELEENVLVNMQELVFPYIEKLKNSHLSESQRAYLCILETHLQDMSAPFLRGLTSQFTHLSPMEIRVATLVKEGKTSKEIAEMLGIAEKTVATHRYNLRAKLGLKSEKIHLRSHLQSFSNTS
jgi:PAS domain S-box-containing protein